MYDPCRDRTKSGVKAAACFGTFSLFSAQNGLLAPRYGSKIAERGCVSACRQATDISMLLVMCKSRLPSVRPEYCLLYFVDSLVSLCVFCENFVYDSTEMNLLLGNACACWDQSC